MSSSADSSPLSTPPPDDSEDERNFSKLTINSSNSNDGLHSGNDNTTEAPKPLSQARKRKAFPARDPLFEDDPRIAVIIAFQSRFHTCMKGLQQIGPQELEEGIKCTPLSEQVENLLCQFLGLLLNRKKNVERAHYGRALEEAVSTHWKGSQESWSEENPLQGSKTFLEMSVDERLKMMHTLVIWALRHSEAIQSVLKDNYKLNRKEDDRNVPVAVTPWGMDRDKKKYYLIEGKDDTTFRVYQEYHSPAGRNFSWYTVAGTIDELREFALFLQEDGSRNAKELREKVLNEIPRFEEGEVKRKRREYRQSRKAYFTQLSAGPSIYEGRTRGKRIKYTYDSDDEGGYTGEEGVSTRSSRRTSPPSNTYTTSSGRQSRRPAPMLGNDLLGSNGTNTPYAVSESGDSVRATRSSRRRHSLMDIDDGNNEYADDGVPSSDDDDGNDPGGGNHYDDDYNNNKDNNDDSSSDGYQDNNDDDEEGHSDDDLDIVPATTSPSSLRIVLKFKNPADLQIGKLQSHDVDFKQQQYDQHLHVHEPPIPTILRTDHEDGTTQIGSLATIDSSKAPDDKSVVINGSDSH